MKTYQLDDGLVRVRFGEPDNASVFIGGNEYDVHPEVARLLVDRSGMKELPPPDPDREAAERIVRKGSSLEWLVGVGQNSGTVLSWYHEAVSVAAARYGISIALREARAEGHAAGVAEARAWSAEAFTKGLASGRQQAIGKLEAMAAEALDSVNQDALRGAAAVLRGWAKGAK